MLKKASISKVSLRETYGQIHTVETQLRERARTKEVRAKLKVLETLEVTHSAVSSCESLVAHAHEIGAWGVKHKAQAIMNHMVKELKKQGVWQVGPTFCR
jgi:3-methyladenine DNA glycosylase Tag